MFAVNNTNLASILYVGVLASLTAYVLWNKAVINVGPARAGMIYYPLPLFSGFTAHFILSELTRSLHLYCALFIVSGILMANYQGRQKK